jgi:hypothetical protein
MRIQRPAHPISASVPCAFSERFIFDARALRSSSSRTALMSSRAADSAIARPTIGVAVYLSSSPRRVRASVLACVRACVRACRTQMKRAENKLPPLYSKLPKEHSGDPL